jgi:hypothetical protein
VSLYLRPDPGNCSELALVGQSLERLAAFAKPGMLMVCDSALGQPKPLCQIHRAGLRFIVPLKILHRLSGPLPLRRRARAAAADPACRRA